MSSGRSQGRRRRGKKPKAVDLWRPVTPLDPPEPIQRASDATAVIRSLGAPPLKGQGVKAEQNLAVAVDKAAELAAEVLALTAGLRPVDGPPDDAPLDDR